MVNSCSLGEPLFHPLTRSPVARQLPRLKPIADTQRVSVPHAIPLTAPLPPLPCEQLRFGRPSGRSRDVPWGQEVGNMRSRIWLAVALTIRDCGGHPER